MLPLRPLAAFLVLTAAAAPSEGKATTGGSKACSHTGFYSKKVVPMCEKHFPEESSKNAWVVQFYHAQVQKSHDARQAYEQLAGSKEIEGAKVGAVDCAQNNQFCGQHGIRTVPTTRILFSGRSRDFEGEHSLEALQSFVLESVKRFKEAEEAMKCEAKGLFTDAMKDSTIPLCTASFPPSVEPLPWIVAFHESGDHNKDKTMRKTMNKMAEKYGNIPPKKVDAKNKKPLKLRVGVVECSHKLNDCEKLGVSNLPVVRFFSKWGEPKDFDSFLDFDELKQFADARLKEKPKEEAAVEFKADMPEETAKAKEDL